MFFNSSSFAIFFCSLFLLCIILQSLGMISMKDRIVWRNVLLLIASYFFYAFLHWQFSLLLLATTLINYLSAIGVDQGRKNGNQQKSRYCMWLAVVGSIGILCYFKYANFFIDSINDALHLLGIGLKLDLIKIILPVGISFFTFQALTYTLDIYSGKMAARRNFINVSLFVSFFPTVLSGPIERARNLLPQIERENKISMDDVFAGGKLFLWGLFKKVVIADRLAVYINAMYANPADQSSLTLIVTAMLYSFQIYADFSGYSDMAIGVGRMLGFRLMENFHYPYFSGSIKEFWKRWHISLTSWFTEYVYIPLGGNRVSTSRWLLNISSIFLLSGLWHGANWTFILWGALHAFYYLCEFYYKKTGICTKSQSNILTKWLAPFTSISIVFILVTIAWIFFRIENLSQINTVFSTIFKNPGTLNWGSSAFATLLTFLLLVLFIGLDWLKYSEKIKWNPYLNVIGYAFLLALIILCGESAGGFVYFQF